MSIDSVSAHCQNKRPSFVNQSSPALCAVITESTPADAIRTIRLAEFEGANSFLFDLRKLRPEFHTEEHLSSIFLSTHLPVMVFYYRREIADFQPVDDQVRADTFLISVKAGAAAIDMMADLFDPNDRELSMSDEAIEKQLALTRQIRAFGGEVLVSSHTLIPMNTVEVMSHVEKLLLRSPDMVKIVPRVATEDDLLEAIKTTVTLRRELSVPFIHIAMGEYNRLHRYVGPMLGSAICFCVVYYKDGSTVEQPLLRATRLVFENANWKTPRSVFEGAGYQVKV